MEREQHIQSRAQTFRGRGDELLQLFDPTVVYAADFIDSPPAALSYDVLKSVASEARKHLFSECSRGICQDQVNNSSGMYELKGGAAEAIRNVGGAVATVLANPEVIRLPDYKAERQGLSHLLIESALHYQGQHTIIAPVCPDYGSGESFYRKMGGGISPEAQAAIEATKVLTSSYTDFLSPNVAILVADTEDDMEEIIENTALGESTVYKSHCESSAEAIREKLHDLPHVNVFTFSQFLGDEFRIKQREGERLIKELMRSEKHVFTAVSTVAEQRIARHSQILARPEEAYELTIRYMAQYMALGEIMRQREEPTLLMNYQTPNRTFYNAAVNVHPQLRFSEQSSRVVPVFGTIARR